MMPDTHRGQRLNPKVRYKDFTAEREGLSERVIMCPHCNKPLFGSASRGHLGKYYPAYHGNKRGHCFRVTSNELEDTVESFVKNLNFTQEYIDFLKEYVVTQWKERVESKQEDESIIDTKIKALKASAQVTADKIKYLSSEVVIKYLEADLVKAECKVQELEEEKLRREKLKIL